MSSANRAMPSIDMCKPVYNSHVHHTNTQHHTYIMAFPKGKQRYDLDHAKKPMSGIKIPKELIEEALTKSRGNISRAADKIGCHRHTLHSRIMADTDLKVHLESFRERFLDDTEDVFQNKVLSGDTTSMLFALKTLGRKRGYDIIERDVVAEGATRGVLDFIFNKSKNPAES